MQITVKIRLWVAELQFCKIHSRIWYTAALILTKYKFYWISKQSIATFICYCKLVLYIWVQYSLDDVNV